MLSRRFGAAGLQRDRVEQRLLARMGAPGPLTEEPGDTAMPARLQALIASAGIAHQLPGWDAHRACEVARWGARLARLGAAPPATTTVEEAAAFNLAVACFDTVVDEAPDDLPLLARSLQPMRLARRLDAGAGAGLAEGLEAGSAATVARLFEHSLGCSARRLASRPAARRELARLLEQMYESEIGTTDDPLLAKTLPTVYIGRLADGHGELFARLARFIADWDDYQDLGGDWAQGQANRYLHVSRARRRRARRAAALARGAARLAFAEQSLSRIEASLSAELGGVLAAAQDAGRLDLTRQLLTRLIAGTP